MGKICAIMQPTYCPWIGYFDLVDQVDVFVFLDDVQFEKRSWQQRNRFRTPKGLEWLTVPVATKGRFTQLISEVTIVPSADFPDGHVNFIRFNYRRSPYFQRYFERFEDILTKAPGKLADLNITIIQWLSSELNLHTQFIRSSSLSIPGARAEKLAGICAALSVTDYLSPAGSMDYLQAEEQFFVEKNINIHIQNYVHPTYKQMHEPFMPFASILDLLFNEGPEALEMLRSGSRPSLALSDWHTA